ncbi:MAG: hypothetical protein ACFHWX_12850 [Bacteroidota bacterium]
MKKNKITIILCTLLVFTGCHKKNYYEVMNTNQQRFGGDQLDNARFLNESYDLILTIEGMSTLAKKRSTLKEQFLLATEASKSAKSLHSNFKWQAVRSRIKLTSSLSNSSDAYLHNLDNIVEANFDMMYVQYMKTKLAEIELKMEKYEEVGKSERLVALTDDVQDSFRPINASIGKIK